MIPPHVILIFVSDGYFHRYACHFLALATASRLASVAAPHRLIAPPTPTQAGAMCNVAIRELIPEALEELSVELAATATVAAFGIMTMCQILL